MIFLKNKRHSYYIFSFIFVAGAHVCSAAGQYRDELLTALSTETTSLYQVARIDNAAALRIVRRAQWHNFVMSTQQRSTTLTDRVGYYLMESQVTPFSHRCSVLMPEEMPQLYRLISGYAAQLKITIPCIVLVNDSKMFEAANVGWNTDSGFIIVGRGVFEEYTDDQLRGLMGYHMGHLAQRTSARLVTLFTPALLAGFALAFYGIGQIDVKNNNMMVASLQAMTILGAYGISMSIIWAFLMRGNESRADQALAKIDPTLGLALLAAIKRARLEDCSGDVAASSRIIASLPALNDSERSAALHSLTILGSMNNTESALREVVDSGFFGTQHSLEHRQAFFESQLLDV